MSSKPPPNQLPPEVVEALRSGHVIEALKRLREATGVGLAEAKALLEAQAAARAGQATVHPHTHPVQPTRVPSASPPQSLGGLSPGEVPRASGSGLATAVLIAIAVVAGAYFLLR